jgi:hypothetical protein
LSAAPDHCSRLLVSDHVVSGLHHAVAEPPIPPQRQIPLNNVRESIEIARQCRTILAANGVTLEYPMLRHANNLESVLTYEGTFEVHQLTVGQALTGIGVLR